MMPGVMPLRHLALDLYATIGAIPDFPKPGILFRDINPMLRSPDAMDEVMRQLGGICDATQPDLIVGIESRGFIVGTPLAHQRRIGFVPVRKPGKLPGRVLGVDYELEYGIDRLEIQADAFAGSQDTANAPAICANPGRVTVHCWSKDRSRVESIGATTSLQK